MGQQFSKRTAGLYDSSSYRLYFEDDGGSPSTILTFFSWPGASRGSAGGSHPNLPLPRLRAPHDAATSDALSQYR
jgi:catechol 2,3-dioxygenase-like lactoylglutathione lyase family enzyme